VQVTFNFKKDCFEREDCWYVVPALVDTILSKGINSATATTTTAGIVLLSPLMLLLSY